MLGYNMQEKGGRFRPLIVLPLILSTALFLISELDSPRGGSIRVLPDNLERLAVTLHT